MHSLRDGIGDYECHARAAFVKMFIVRITADVVRRHFFLGGGIFFWKECTQGL